MSFEYRSYLRVLRGVLRRDEENPYLTAKAPMAGGPPTVGQRFWKELRQNWWLWGSVVFAILLVGGLLLFRNQLYDSATHGLPFLAGIPLSPSEPRNKSALHLSVFEFISLCSLRCDCSSAWHDLTVL